MGTHDLIKSRRLRLGLTEQELASQVGVSRGAVQQWEREGGTAPKRGNQAAVAKVLGLTVAQLMSGEEPDAKQNTSTAAVGTTRIPLISHVQAGNLTAIMDDHAPGAAAEYLLTDLPVSKHTFALEIKGTSMEPDFKEGDRVIIDPEVQPQPGDFVAAKITDSHGDGEATFKKYRPRGTNDRGDEVFELTPLNEDFPSLRSDSTPLSIIGTMVEHRRYRRRR